MAVAEWAAHNKKSVSKFIQDWLEIAINAEWEAVEWEKIRSAEKGEDAK